MRLCLVVFMSVTWSFVDGHARFVCPRPQSPRSDIYVQLPEHPLDGQCGLGSTISFDSEYMEVSPGPFTLKFEETVIHKDSPFQISLHHFDDVSNTSTKCILLDHIPHNNNATVSKGCKMNDYPIGHCDGSIYYITVNIPDVNCDRCFLKLTYVSIDTATALPCGIGNNTCRQYISCANIKIRYSPAGKMKNLSFCENYVDNLMGPWPFRPLEMYMTSFNAPTAQVLNATGTFDHFAKSFILHFPSHIFNNYVEVVEVLCEVDDGNSTSFETIFTEKISNQSSAFSIGTVTWNDLNRTVINELKSEKLILKLSSSQDSVNGTISLSHEQFGIGHYEGFHALYSHQGWLSGCEFIGPRAQYPAVVSPFGPCVEATSNYIAFLHAGDQDDVHGVLAMSFIDERVHVTLSVTGLKNNITSVDITGPALAGPPTLNIPITTAGALHLTLNASVQIRDIGSLKFLNKVTVCTADSAERLEINLEEGIYALIIDERKLYGAGIFQLTKGRWLKFEIVLKGVEGHISYVTLNGPDQWGFTGSVKYKLTEYAVLKDNGDVFIAGSIKDLSSDFLLALWKGLITINIKTHTNKSENFLFGKLSSPGVWYCTEIKGAPCPSVNLKPEYGVVDDGAEVVPASGIASIVLDRTNVLQYSILVENSQVPATKKLKAEIVHGSKTILPIQLTYSKLFNKAFEVHNVITEPEFQLISALSTERVHLRVLEVDGKKARLTGKIPPVFRSVCTQPKNIIVGEEHGNWSTKAAPLGSLYTLLEDQLVFTFSGNDSVHLMLDKEHFDDCNFENATQIGAPPHTSDKLSVDYRLKKLGVQYFSSEANCNSTQPLKLIVKILHPVPVKLDLNECSESLYDVWRKQELNKYITPNPAGAAVGGLIAGIIILAIFVVWDRRIHDKKSGDVSMFERF